MKYIEKNIPEIYFIKHCHDDNNHYTDYQKNILLKSVSPFIVKSPTMFEFLSYIQKIVSMMFDNVNVIRNYRNYILDKDDFRHIN